MNRCSVVHVRHSRLLPSFFLLPLAWAQSPGAGTIEGRVYNETSGSYLENARVTIEGSTRRAELQLSWPRPARADCDDNAAQWLDTSYLEKGGSAWVSTPRDGLKSELIRDTFQKPPEYFSRPEATVAANWRANVNAGKRNLLNEYKLQERFGPSAPPYARLRSAEDTRRQFTFGVRG